MLYSCTTLVVCFWCCVYARAATPGGEREDRARLKKVPESETVDAVGLKEVVHSSSSPASSARMEFVAAAPPPCSPRLNDAEIRARERAADVAAASEQVQAARRLARASATRSHASTRAFAADDPGSLRRAWRQRLPLRTSTGHAQRSTPAGSAPLWSNGRHMTRRL